MWLNKADAFQATLHCLVKNLPDGVKPSSETWNKASNSILLFYCEVA